MSDHPAPSAADESPDEEPDDHPLPPFTPVPTRFRRDGWTPAKQHAFLAALRRTGQVGLAARAVGMSHQSAWRLRARADAKSFAAAWDKLLDEARALALDIVVERGLQGGMVPRYYRGRFVRLEHHDDNRALITALRYFQAHPPGR